MRSKTHLLVAVSIKKGYKQENQTFLQQGQREGQPLYAPSVALVDQHRVAQAGLRRVSRLNSMFPLQVPPSSLFSLPRSRRAETIALGARTLGTLGRVAAELGVVQVAIETSPPAGHVMHSGRWRHRGRGLNRCRFLLGSFFRSRGLLLVALVGPVDTVSNATVMFCCVPTLIGLVNVYRRTRSGLGSR